MKTKNQSIINHKQLRILIANDGRSIKEIADAAGIPASTIYNAMHRSRKGNTVSALTAYAVAGALGVTTDKLGDAQ